MVSKALIKKRVNSAKKYLKIIQYLKQFSREEIQKDDIVRGAVERYVYIVCQICIDLADMIISFKKERKPINFEESFSILMEDKDIDYRLFNAMVEMVKIRNILTFDYDKVNYDIVFDVLTNKKTDIDRFISIIEKKILK